MQNRRWILFGAAVVLLGAAILTVGCTTSSSKPKLRLFNGTLDEPSLDLLVDSASTATGVAYGNASSYVSVTAGSRNLQAEVTGTSTIIASATESVTSGDYYTFMTLNCSTCGTSPVFFTDDNTLPPSGDFNLRIINASPGLGAQDVYVNQSSGPTGTPYASSLGLGSASGYDSLALGTWNVYFTSPGGTFVNANGTVTVSSTGSVRTLVVFNAPAGSGSPFSTTVLSDLN